MASLHRQSKVDQTYGFNEIHLTNYKEFNFFFKTKVRRHNFICSIVYYTTGRAMGVTILQPYQLPENKCSAHAAVDQLSKRLLSLGAVHTGQFLVDCESYISTPQHGAPTRAVHVLHSSEYPASTFSIIDNGTGKQVPLIADNLFDLLMLKMTTSYTSKKQTKIESRGARFEYGDFLIKIGSVTMMEQFKGILIEIEYRSCIMLSYCWDMIREMLQGFLGVPVAKDYPPYFTTQTVINAMGQQQLHPKQNDIYDPMDTINQYLEHFTNYRKHVHMHGPMSNVGGLGGVGMGGMGVGVVGVAMPMQSIGGMRST